MSTVRLEPMTGTPTETRTEALPSKLGNPVTSPQFDFHAGVNEMLKDDAGGHQGDKKRVSRAQDKKRARQQKREGDERVPVRAI